MFTALILILGTGGYGTAEEQAAADDDRHNGVAEVCNLEILERVASADIQLFPKPQVWIHSKRPLARWRIRYTLRYLGDTPLKVDSETARWQLTGWVANSRVPSHGHPRFVDASGHMGEIVRTPVLRGKGGWIACTDIARVTLGPSPDHPDFSGTILPGESLTLWVTLMHDHRVWSGFDLLLGDRELSVTLGDIRDPNEPSSVRAIGFRDTLPLSEAPGLRLVAGELLPIRSDWQTEREDNPPESVLFLQTTPTKFLEYQFDRVCVRPSTSYRIQFSYCMAEGSEGCCRLVVREYDDYENMFQMTEDILPLSRSWAPFSRVVTTSEKTETIMLQCALWNTSYAAAWIRDIELVPPNEPLQRKP